MNNSARQSFPISLVNIVPLQQMDTCGWPRRGETVWNCFVPLSHPRCRRHYLPLLLGVERSTNKTSTPIRRVHSKQTPRCGRSSIVYCTSIHHLKRDKQVVLFCVWQMSPWNLESLSLCCCIQNGSSGLAVSPACGSAARQVFLVVLGTATSYTHCQSYITFTSRPPAT